MSASVNLETALRPFAAATNIGFNSLTRLFYSCLNPLIDRKALAAAFHYDSKVTVYNGATLFISYKIAHIALDKGSLGSNLLGAVVALFIRSVMEQTLSMKGGAKVLVKGVFSNITGQEDIESISIFDNTFSMICVAASKALSLTKNKSWQEDMLAIQGYSILRNWSRTVPDLILRLQK